MRFYFVELAIYFDDASQFFSGIADPHFGTKPVDQEIRNKIIVHAIRRWCLYAVATLLLVSLGSICMRPSEPAFVQVANNLWYLAPVAVASLLLLPLLVREMLIDNNRVTGPLRRLGGEIQKLRDGEAIRPLQLREGDHWRELANDFNTLVDQIHSERNQDADDIPPRILSICRADG